MSILHTLSAMAAAGLELVLYLIGWLLVALLAVYGLSHQIILHAVGIARGTWTLRSTRAWIRGAQARHLDSGEARRVASY